MDKQELFKISGIKHDDDFDTIKKKLKWQTRGRTGTENLLWVRLIDCDTDHLENIVYNVPKLYPITKRVILSILKDRWKKEKLSVMDIRLKAEGWKKEGYSVDELENVLESLGYEYE